MHREESASIDCRDYNLPMSRVSFETSFDSNQPKLEPKLVSALSETKFLFRLFRFYIETESFDVSAKQTEDQPKQFDREHILLFFTENVEFFRFFVGFFVCLVFFGLFQLFRFYTETESFDVLIEPKQTEDPPEQFKREHIWVFFRKFRVVSVCFGLLRNSSICFGCFDIGSKHRNKPKFLVFGFTKQTETNAKQILFRFVSVRTEIYFCLFRGHPTYECTVAQCHVAVRMRREESASIDCRDYNLPMSVQLRNATWLYA
jgi:hypothetical protein